jgi:hypothetical protein
MSLQVQDNKSISRVQNFSRLLEEISLHPPFKNYAVYFMCDFVKFLHFASCTSEAKAALMPGVYSILGMCSESEYHQLNVLLMPSEKAIFKTMYAEFEKDFKFKGKV